FSQTVNGWAAGTYQISFQAAQRAGNNQNFEVLIDNGTKSSPLVLQTFGPTGTGYQTYTTPAFNVAAGSHTITFKGLDDATGDNTALIDSVSVRLAAVPLVGDAGFEQPKAGPAGGYSSFVTPSTGQSPWTFAGTAGVAANGSGYTGTLPAPE